MNTKFNEFDRFKWHSCCTVHAWPTAKDCDTDTKPIVIDGTHFIPDHSATGSLLTLRDLIDQQREFCVLAADPATAFTLEREHSDAQPDAQTNNSGRQTTGGQNMPGQTTDGQTSGRPEWGKQNRDKQNRDKQKPAEAFFQCMSAGSNGKPKRIRRTHASWLRSFAVNASDATINDQDSYAIVGKICHSLALYAALEAANLGADIHALSGLRPDHQLTAMKALGSSILYATPTQLRLLCDQIELNNMSGLQIRRIYSGGGKLDSKTAQRIGNFIPKAIVQEFYGASETSFITMSDNQTPTGSVGRAYPGVELFIHTDDPLARLPVGEIYVTSPYLFHEYVNASDELAAARWYKGHLSVGEIGYIDENGYLFLTGRLTRRINIAEQLVYPEEIENILMENRRVSACAVLPVVDDIRGQVFVALVEADNCQELQQSLLLDLRQRVGSLKAPRRIICVERLPLLASGKPDLKAAEALVHAL